MKSNTLTHIALATVTLIYGSNYTIAREVMSEGYIEPLGFILLRASSAVVTFWVISLFVKPEKIAVKDYGLFFLCGLFGVAINQMCFFMGLKFTTPINASLVMTTTPLLTLLAAAFLLGEAITRRKLIGIGIGLIGAVIIIGYGQTIDLNLTNLKGDLLVFTNAMSYGLYLVLVKSLLKKYHPLTVIKWIFTIGVVMVLPFGYHEVAMVEWASFPLHIWLAVAFVLLFTTCVAYLLNIFALSNVPSSVVSIYIFLQPVVATIVALLLGRDELSLLKISAAVLIFWGVYLVSIAGKRSVNVMAKPPK